MPVMAPDLNAMSRPPAKALRRGLRGAHVGAHRHVHADEAGGTRQDGADQEADGDLRRAGSQDGTKTTAPTMAMVVYWRFR
jgi:hypothetical protein